MERMERKIGKRKVEIHKMEGLYPYVRLEDFMYVVKQLEEENKKLKSDLAFERTMLDNVRAEYKSLQNVNKKLNIKVASLEGEIKGLNYTIDRLHKEIEELEKPHPRFSDFGGYDNVEGLYD